jgi:PAS domain S-box-containing protein
MEKRTVINIIFAGTIIIMSVIIIIVILNFALLKENSLQLKRSYSTISLLGKIEKAMLDAETGQRGFILTHNSSYLEPFYGAKKEINILIQQYKELEDNQDNLQQFFHLEEFISKKFFELNYTVGLKERNHTDSAIARINSNIGKSHMDSIRSSMANILSRENSELKYFEEQSALSIKRTIWGCAIGLTASFVMVMFVFVSLKRENELNKKLRIEADRGRLFFSTSLISIGDAVITTNEERIVTFMNKVAEKVTKWTNEEAKGRPVETIFNIYKEGTREHVESPVKKAIDTKEVVGLCNHTILLDRFNNEIHIDDSAAPILNEKEEVTGAVLIFRDITKKRQTEIDLEQSYKHTKELNEKMDVKLKELENVNKELESFTYSVSHDLRAPLRSINGFSKIILDEYGQILDEEGKRLLNIVRENAAKMGEFIDELLNFAKMGRKALIYKVNDFGKLVNDAIDVMGHEINDRSIFKIHPLLPSYSDEVLMFEVWKNLISNAVKFSSKNESPQIEIGCEVLDDSTRYYVKDNGVGFNMGYYKKLFGVFNRLHADVEFPGNGVGLALCEKIIRLHGGKIWAESIENVETVFSFTIPNKPNKNIES